MGLTRIRSEQISNSDYKQSVRLLQNTNVTLSGVATKLFNEDFVPGCIIGKALENHNSENPGTIEILVGKL